MVIDDDEDADDVADVQMTKIMIDLNLSLVQKNICFLPRYMSLFC